MFGVRPRAYPSEALDQTLALLANIILGWIPVRDRHSSLFYPFVSGVSKGKLILD